MFEPIHGSAFDITGKGVANPIGAFWTGALLLEHLGEKEAGTRLMSAIETVTADKVNHCPDLGGKATTRLVTDAVISAMKTTRSLRETQTRSGRNRPSASERKHEWLDSKGTCEETTTLLPARGMI